MRRVTLTLTLIIVAGAGGLTLAAFGLAPAAGAVTGLCLVAGVIATFGVSTDDLAMAAVAALVFTITWNGLRVGGGAFGDVFLALASAAVLAHVIADKRPLPLPPWLCVAGIGFFLAGLLSLVFPPPMDVVQRSVVAVTTIKLQDGGFGLTVFPGNVSTLVKYEVSLILIPLLIATVGTTGRRCLRLMNLWAAGAVINAGVALADYAGVAHITPVAIANNRSAGLTVQANYLALTCVIAIPLAMLWFGRSRRWTLAGLLALPVLLGGVYASGSRAGTVAALLAVVGTLVVVPRFRPGLRFVLPVGGMAIILLLMFTSTGARILHQVRLASSNTTSVSNYQRTVAAQVALEQISARPIEGVGFSVIANAHDIYLELLDAGGIIALGAFLVFLGGLWRTLRRSRAGPLRDEAAVCALAIVVWLANGVFDNQLADKYLYVVPGLLYAISRVSLMQPSTTVDDLLPSRTLVARSPSHPTLTGVAA